MGSIREFAVIATVTLKKTLELIIFSALLSLIVIVAVPYGTVDPIFEMLFECSVFVLALLWIIQGLQEARWLLPEHIVLLPILFLVVFACFQTLPITRSPVGGWVPAS